MSIFSKLKEAIFSKTSRRKSEVSTGVKQPTPSNSPSDKSVEFPIATSLEAAEVEKLTAEELAHQLDIMAGENPEELDWRKSIVDLMKLVGMDSSFAERKELALELGYPHKDIAANGSAKMNIWLHEKVLEQLSNDTDGDLSRETA